MGDIRLWYDFLFYFLNQKVKKIFVLLCAAMTLPWELSIKSVDRQTHPSLFQMSKKHGKRLRTKNLASLPTKTLYVHQLFFSFLFLNDF